MSEKEMNSYRLTSLEEAHKKFFQEIKEYIRKQRVKWGEEYNVNFSNE